MLGVGQLLQRIAQESRDAYPGIATIDGVCGGEPVIVRTRIPVCQGVSVLLLFSRSKTSTRSRSLEIVIDRHRRSLLHPSMVAIRFDVAGRDVGDRSLAERHGRLRSW
jgi:hypothetical protein